ncbi:MAG: GNAT family N-acetyltransferase [Pseudomonadota bacterium]
MSADLEFRAYVPEMAAKLAVMIARIGPATDPTRQFYEARLRSGFASDEAVIVALSEKEPVGLGLLIARPICTPGGRFALAVAPGSAAGEEGRNAVAETHGASALERALWDALVDRGRALGLDAFHSSVPDAYTAYGAYLDALGFAPHDALDCMELPTGVAPHPAPAGVHATRYLGDPEELDAIAAICNTALRNEHHVPPTDGEGIRRLMAMPGASWFIARETETGRIAAVAETNAPEGAFHMVAVRRRYWGTGLAEHIVTFALADLREAGVPVANTLVRSANAASIALQQRLGGRMTGQRIILYRRTL